MIYKDTYKTPSNFSDMIMTSDGEYLTGLWFKGSKDELKHKEEGINKSLSILDDTKKWLDIYFSGNEPNFTPKYKIDNTTDFRKNIISKMNQIPYGKVVSYGDIAREVAKERGIKKMSAQAVGGAVGANPICIIIPCHRVIGTDRSLTGYGGGIKNKIELLKLEGYLKNE